MVLFFVRGKDRYQLPLLLLAVEVTLLNMFVNRVEKPVLNWLAIAASATTTIPARTAYSIALTPRSSRTKAFISLRIFLSFKGFR
ncbi:hypothetical protein AWB78_05492 [Caballeronia calidae]|uniref:Uncharacterized protein n=1 Tax=Caballeronia calidae TaxID=1777139 RepID=A0A158DS77_9BURK|nr:hypothetical protein AWB78_05492 [Caballeronia calidae]